MEASFFFSSKMPVCALKGHWVSLCLVDEAGSGAAYGGLAYTIRDSAGHQYKGRLTGEGYAKLQGFYCGPVVLILEGLYSGEEQPYLELSTRRAYRLPITELQIRAEKHAFPPLMANASRAILHSAKLTGFIRLKCATWSGMSPTCRR